MRTRGALAPRSPSSWNYARDGRCQSPSAPTSSHRVGAPSRALAPSPPTVRILYRIVGSRPPERK
eukprot:5956716-Pleurochrysis_carterae.AAC.1